MKSKLTRLIAVRLLVVTSTVLLVCSTGLADSADDWARMKPIVPTNYICLRTSTPPKIDGKLDDDAWKGASWTDDFLDIEGDRRPRPRLRTRTKMLWDADYFYIAAELEEPHVWGTLTQHDAVIFQDNDFELFIDPDGDNHEYFEFEINALNTGWDLFLPKPYKDGGVAENRWEIPGLVSAVQVDGTLNDAADRDRGWTVELAIPWSALREYARQAAPPRDGDQWRVNFSRVEWQHQIVGGKYEKVPNTKEDNWVWSPQGIIDMHRPERWGYVQFSEGTPATAKFLSNPIRPGRDLLMEVYHLQKSYYERHHRWAESVEQLGWNAGVKERPLLKLTETGYRATLDLPAADGWAQSWSVRHDSRLRLTSPDDDLSDTLERILAQQVKAWNDGDIDTFMEYYWKSDHLTFSSGGRITRGWTKTKQGYQKRYPTREKMGQLSFGALEVQRLGDHAALVLGRWDLQRESAPIGGNFTLVFQAIGGAWVIVHDHTSLEKGPESATPSP